MIIVILVFGWLENVPSGLDSSPGRGARGVYELPRAAQPGPFRCFARGRSTPGVAQEQLESSHGLFGSPRVCPTLRQLWESGLAGRASSEHHFPLCIEPLCIQRALGRISWSSPPSPDLVLQLPVLCCSPCKARVQPGNERFLGTHKSAVASASQHPGNALGVPHGADPVGWQQARDCPLHTQPISRESWSGLGWKGL